MIVLENTGCSGVLFDMIELPILKIHIKRCVVLHVPPASFSMLLSLSQAFCTINVLYSLVQFNYRVDHGGTIKWGNAKLGCLFSILTKDISFVPVIFIYFLIDYYLIGGGF